MSLLIPNYYYKSAADITPEFLRGCGICGLLLDIDNTLTRHNESGTSKEIALWLQELKDEGFAVCIVSNGKSRRVEPFANSLKLPYVHTSRKPLRSGIFRALKILKLQKNEVCIVGDQIFTDIAGGNAVGLTTILVKPLSPVESYSIRLKRGFEKPFIHHFIKKGGRLQ